MARARELTNRDLELRRFRACRGSSGEAAQRRYASESSTCWTTACQNDHPPARGHPSYELVSARIAGPTHRPEPDLLQQPANARSDSTEVAACVLRLPKSCPGTVSDPLAIKSRHLLPADSPTNSKSATPDPLLPLGGGYGTRSISTLMQLVSASNAPEAIVASQSPA